MPGRVTLSPLKDVEQRGGGFVALSREPWLLIESPILTRSAGRLVEIVYRASFWDVPARPLFRFALEDGTAIEHIAAAPVVGAGIWIGRVPQGTVRVDVSPTNREGSFGFVIESVRRRSWLALVAAGFRRAPRAARSAILTRLIGWARESDVNLAWAIGSTPLRAYAAWRRRRHRAVDLADLDAPRVDWDNAAKVLIYIDARDAAANGTQSGLDVTLASLQAQLFSGWRAVVLGAEARPLLDDPRIMRAASSAILSGAYLVGTLRPGDRLEPHALACFAEAADRHPAGRLFYGDEETDSADSPMPIFKPGWSPLLQKQQPFLGRCFFLRAPMAGWSRQDEDSFVARARIPDHVLDRLERTEVVALRRILLRTTEPAKAPVGPLAAPVRPEASVAIIIPTRDRAALLRRALESIRRFPAKGRTQILIVDNGSVETETKRLFDELRPFPDVSVLDRPGPFNFSALCNGAAATTQADVLLFLNNDTEALEAGWLDRLIGWALQPGIGAVGARLVYPDGRLQHIGVVVGMGESAGHFGADAAADAPGWARRNMAVHEVSAVTGACLAVAREKFEAVGGFDADALPIELSDIDLCLKLAARGWTSIVDPAVRLLHDESASRGGATLRRLDVYESQRAAFKARWRSALRDDPYFHPGLSLFHSQAALG